MARKMFYGIWWKGTQSDMMREKKENMIPLDGSIDLDMQLRIHNLAHHVQNLHIVIKIFYFL